MKTQAELNKIAAYENMMEYTRWSVAVSFIIVFCVLISGFVGKHVDQEMGIYKYEHVRKN